MQPGPLALTASQLAALALSFVLSGCGLEPRSQLLPNQPPEITLDRPRIYSGEDSQSLSFTWKARDPDGRVDHYVFVLDPASVDRIDPSWRTTREATTTLSVPRAVTTGRAAATGEANALMPHVFAVRAVDDRGAMSALATIALFADNIAPVVYIVDPAPNSVFTPITPTSLDIRWTGSDLDGQIVKYKYRLFGAHNPDFPGIPDFISFATNDPNAFRDLYTPGFQGWDSVGPETTSVRYSNLVPNQLYLFAITAFDDDGDYDPVFSANKNILKFAVSEGTFANPHLCVASPLFNYCSQVGGDVELSYEIPATASLPVTWFAVPAAGSDIAAYRWVLDPLDPSDEKERSQPTSDPNHWTPWSLGTTSTTLGPFAQPSQGGEHTLYVQAKDTFDRISTLRIHLTVIRAMSARELLIVDDTRLMPDQVRSGVLDPPHGTWPNAAELDTFLYARGGYPYRGYPTGAVSRPGILDGYDFDTLGTRGIASGIVPLSVLSQYRQVMWMTDDVGATYTGSPVELLAPTTSLRLMSSPGQMNTLSAYVAQGGKLWLSGGGAAYTTLVAWGRRNTPSDDWTNTDQELIAGRFMFDFAHWQSSVVIRPARQALINTPEWAPWLNAQMGRGWSGHGIDRNLNQPDYSKLAAFQILQARTCTSDPPPPLRFCDPFFWQRPYPAEFIGRVPPSSSPPNYVREDADPRPNHERLESTLDTLYLAVGGSMPGPLPVMTYYHGFESGPVVFSGFPIWYFQRVQCQAIVDFVLQDIWGLSRRSGASAMVAASRRR